VIDAYLAFAHITMLLKNNKSNVVLGIVILHAVIPDASASQTTLILLGIRIIKV